MARTIDVRNIPGGVRITVRDAPLMVTKNLKAAPGANDPRRGVHPPSQSKPSNPAHVRTLGAGMSAIKQRKGGYDPRGPGAG